MRLTARLNGYQFHVLFYAVFGHVKASVSFYAIYGITIGALMRQKAKTNYHLAPYPPPPQSHPAHHASVAHHQWCKCHPAYQTTLPVAGSVAQHRRKVAIKTSLRGRALRIVFRAFSLAAELPKRADIFPQYLPQQYQVIMGFILKQVFTHRDVIGLA